MSKSKLNRLGIWNRPGSVNASTVAILSLAALVRFSFLAPANCDIVRVEPPIIPSVEVRLVNDTAKPLNLFRVERDQRVNLKQLGSHERETFLELPSGVYFVQNNETEIRVPIPALRKLINGSLTIEVSSSRIREGYCWIPAGPAIVGDTLGIGSEDERPVRICDIPAFWIGATEVTNRQFSDFLNEHTSVDANLIEENWVDLQSRKCRIKPRDGVFRSDAPDLPVVMVSYYGAEAYCKWLTEKTGLKHRLPTESEWEKAARGPESFVFAYGNTYQQSKANQESGMLKNVRSYSPNGFGLYDMTGNAFEWMANQYDPDSRSSMNQSLRGGSFVLDGMYLRNSFRMRQSPTVMTDDIGFRVLCEVNKN